MGGPLSCTMANFYLCHVENQIMEISSVEPSLYCRFMDDIFAEVKDESHLNLLPSQNFSAARPSREVAPGMPCQVANQCGQPGATSVRLYK